MIRLEFKPFLPQEKKPKRFEKFRNIASEIYKNLNGIIVFCYIPSFEQFDIERIQQERAQ